MLKIDLMKEDGEELINEALNTSKQAFELNGKSFRVVKNAAWKISINGENINIVKIIRSN